MKALSIRQPWAWLIVNGFKTIENREWPTSLRGPILIHASKSLSLEDWVDGLNTAVYATRRNVDEIAMPKRRVMRDTICGGIVGRAVIVDCVTEHPSPWFFGRYGFILDQVEPLPFRPWKGQLGFFDVPYELGLPG